LTGALLVDKPSGPTSHDVVAFARRLLKSSRVGHTGTLDPLATGLLVLLVGSATRLARFLVADEKEYIADIRLGMATPTYDAASLFDVRGPGRDVRGPACEVRGSRSKVRSPIGAELEAVLNRFRGSFLQTPPPYSAKKVGGVAAYEKARRNQPVELRPVEVTVRELELLPTHTDTDTDTDTATDTETELLRLRVVASAGFYVRSLAHDLGQALGCGAHLEALRRTRVGRFRIEDAATLDQLQAHSHAAERIVQVNALLSDFPAVTVNAEGLRRAANGNPLGPRHLEGTVAPGSVPLPPVFRVLDASGETMAVAEGRPDGLLHPVVVLG
jgi:tRNA pseudouridine55 synthase